MDMHTCDSLQQKEIFGWQHFLSAQKDAAWLVDQFS